MSPTLDELLERSAERHSDRVAVLDPARGRSVAYGKLAHLVGSLAHDLSRAGAGRGHRVGLCAPKSIPSVTALLATLEAGGAYVPVDAAGPLRRGVQILTDCDVTAVVSERRIAESLKPEFRGEMTQREFSARAELAELGGDLVLLVRGGDKAPSPEGLAYVLYTSGSTGTPKGVMHTHASARAFVDWCSETFEPTPGDRFSSHAPFHFDLSILDLYVPLAHGGAIVLIGEDDGKNPLRLASVIADCGLTIWYSTPSVLRLLIEHGGLERRDASALRTVLFAGEVFAPGHLRRLQAIWPHPRYFNLYGPTETNVCTSFEIVEEVPADRRDPYPIGKPISGNEAMVIDARDHAVTEGFEGELLVRGGTVMTGYWNRPDLDEQSFHVDERGRRWYRTGDLVQQTAAGDYVFLGRRDRMVKRRGYRVELDEIEASLYRARGVAEAAVVAIPDSDAGLQVIAFVDWRNVASPSTIALKRFCAEQLPLYMVPDRFVFVDELPKTSTDKIDYMKLIDSMNHGF